MGAPSILRIGVHEAHAYMKSGPHERGRAVRGGEGLGLVVLAMGCET